MYKKGGFSLSKVGDMKDDMKSVEAQATKFIWAAYGNIAESCLSMMECRVKMWHSKRKKSGASSEKLCSLPPTSGIHRICSQMPPLSCDMEHSALLQSPPNMELTKYGWELDHQGILLSCTVPADTLPEPPGILQLIHRNRKTSGCHTAACSCSRLGCTILCLCEDEEACTNHLTWNESEEDKSEKDTEELDEDNDVTYQ